MVHAGGYAARRGTFGACIARHGPASLADNWADGTARLQRLCGAQERLSEIARLLANLRNRGRFIQCSEANWPNTI